MSSHASYLLRNAKKKPCWALVKMASLPRRTRWQAPHAFVLVVRRRSRHQPYRQPAYAQSFIHNTHTHTYTNTRTATTQPHCRTHSHAYGWTWGSLASVHRHRMRTFLSGHFLWHTELIHIQLHSGTWVGSIVGAYIHSSSRTKSVIGTDRLADRNKQHRSAYCESDFTLWRFRFCRLV